MWEETAPGWICPFQIVVNDELAHVVSVTKKEGSKWSTVPWSLLVVLFRAAYDGDSPLAGPEPNFFLPALMGGLAPNGLGACGVLRRG